MQYVATQCQGRALDSSIPVTVNFHPDWLVGDRPVIEALVDDGFYRSQFVTGTSNGGLTAYPGGDRWQWESRMFGGAYDRAPVEHRPIYGALNFRHLPFGAAPRFGSAHLRLTTTVLDRTTFCYPDSHLNPSHFGVASSMGLIALAEMGDTDLLDTYIEAHIHGPVRLDRDVEAIVLDPSHRGTGIETAARRLPCAVEWHHGFHLGVSALREHPDYRGAHYVDLGTSIAVNGVLDASVLGRAAQSGEYDAQSLKKVWHYLARFGMNGSDEPNAPQRRDRPSADSLPASGQ
ncbi:DUF3626 domain-containing protein [Nocardia salmonicida]|uniref:DUF3626 domain-containing protein n=1 Tax=Nocardia salmonicida TaxID=53431 RepID=UPI0033EBEC3A